ncbi:MAG: EpsG family protein [Mucinivorans sp.]
MMSILPYIALFFVFFLMSNFDIWNIKLNQRSKRWMYFCALALMVLFAGCRWFNVPLNPEPGVWIIFDYTAYETVYDNPLSITNFFSDWLDSGNIAKSMDPGYVFISSFFSNYIFTNANLFFLTLSLFTVVVFAKGLNRNHINYGIFIILFIFLTRLYFQYNFIMMRQAVAMSIVWWAIPFIHKKQFWKFTLFCILGGLFHFTAFLFVIVYFLPRFQFSNKFLLICLPILFAFSLLGITDFVILKILSTGLGSIGLDDKINAYIGNELYSRGINPLNFVEIVPFLYFAIKYRVSMCATQEGKFFFNLFILYIVFMIITMNMMALTRISSYYLYSIFFIVSFAFKEIRLLGNRVIYGYAFIIYFFIYGVRFINANFPAYGYHLFFLN